MALLSEQMTMFPGRGRPSRAASCAAVVEDSRAHGCSAMVSGKQRSAKPSVRRPSRRAFAATGQIGALAEETGWRRPVTFPSHTALPAYAAEDLAVLQQHAVVGVSRSHARRRSAFAAALPPGPEAFALQATLAGPQRRPALPHRFLLASLPQRSVDGSREHQAGSTNRNTTRWSSRHNEGRHDLRARIYGALRAALPALLKCFETTALRRLGKARHQAGRLLDRGDRRLEPGPVLTSCNGTSGRAGEEMDGVLQRSGVDRQARRDQRDGPIVASLEDMILQPTKFSSVK